MTEQQSEDRPVVTQADIFRGLREMGLGGGDTILVHSSLKSFGHVEGGPEAVIEALLELVGPRGCIVMPTLTLGAATNPVVFDVRNSPSTSGRITEVFRLRSDAWRSLHPTGSAAAVGWAAEELTRYHTDTPCSLASPYGQVYLRGGWCLFLGAPWWSNSMFHLAEELAMPDYLRFAEFRDATVIDAEGVSRTVTFRRYNCRETGARRDLGAMAEHFESAGAVRHARIGASDCRLISAHDNVGITVKLLKDSPEKILSYEKTTMR